MKKFIVFFVLALLGINLSLQAMYQPSYENIADKITSQTIDELQCVKQLVPAGTGGSMMDDIKMMAISFDYFHEIDIEEARRLIIQVVQKYLNNINNCAELKPYLHNYPFEPKNIEIRIFLSRVKQKRISSGKLDYVSSIKGKINYRSHNNEDQIVPIKEETFEEAVKLVNEQK